MANLEISEELATYIRAFVENKDAKSPELEDLLPAVWDRSGPTVGDPNGPTRMLALESYSSFSLTKRWAWDGLDRLHKVLMARGEQIPELLQAHVNEAYSGQRKPPNKPRNPRYAPQDSRDFRIMQVLGALCRFWPEKAAKNAIMIILDHMDDDTIRSIFRKMDSFWPDPPSGGTKQTE